MTRILIAAGVALAVAILLTPVLIRVFTELGFGQPIRDEAPEAHQRKRGTPTDSPTRRSRFSTRSHPAGSDIEIHPLPPGRVFITPWWLCLLPFLGKSPNQWPST